jgi:hypothetical protein
MSSNTKKNAICAAMIGRGVKGTSYVDMPK